MNIKKLFLLVNLFLCAEVAFAGTVTIKSPPPGVRLLTTSGTIEPGGPDWTKTTTSNEPNILINISPEVEIAGQKKIIGMVSISHSSNATGQMFSNQNSCTMNADATGYSVTVDNVGFQSKTCNVGERELNNQSVSQGVANVVVTYKKTP